jgi:hypothetical protein
VLEGTFILLLIHVFNIRSACEVNRGRAVVDVRKCDRGLVTSLPLPLLVDLVFFLHCNNTQ